MRALVLTSSRHGSTTAIGTQVADRLRLGGHDVVCRGVQSVGDADLVQAGAVVLGTATYGGRLLASGVAMAQRLADEFMGPVWHFAVGLENLSPDPLAAMLVRPARGGYRSGWYPVFGGVVHRDRLSPSERALVRALGAATRDLRDEAPVAAWATVVADRLRDAGQGSSSTLPVV